MQPSISLRRARTDPSGHSGFDLVLDYVRQRSFHDDMGRVDAFRLTSGRHEACMCQTHQQLSNQPLETRERGSAMTETLHEAAQAYLEHLKGQGKKGAHALHLREGPRADRGLLWRRAGSSRASWRRRWASSSAPTRSSNSPAGRKRSRPTVEKTKRVLRMFLVWAHETGRIDKLPLPKGTAMGRSAKKEGRRPPA